MGQNGRPPIRELESFFFRANLANGWCLGDRCVKSISCHDPGYKRIEYAEGDLRYLDRYCVGVAGVDGLTPSMGDTTIYFRDKPAWVMHFGGAYAPRVTVAVKAALLIAYKLGKFIAGRGLQRFAHGDQFRYLNDPIPGGEGGFRTFSNFECHEQVIEFVNGKPEPRGYHLCHGRLLIPAT